jgi:glutamyl-tRNA synthetase
VTLPADAADVARKYALQNAVQHGGKADPGRLNGKILGERADLRPHARELMPILQQICAEVNAMDADAQKAALAALDPALLEKKVIVQRTGLKPLPGDDVPQIVMRFAPNPNGPATLGHSRGMVLHAEYQRMYTKDLGKKLKMILRYDDTDPATKIPVLEAYDSLKADFEWLGGHADHVLCASDRFPLYYQHAEQVIQKGHAYVCECSQDVFKPLKDAGLPCPHRSQTPADNLAKWKRMHDKSQFAPGQAVLRIATDIQHPDPALRDWVAFRILDASHPRIGDTYRVWPMLDFQSAIEDRLQGVTHIMRGKDLIDSEHKQKFVYQYMGWTYPTTVHWGRVKIHEFGKVSKSLLGEGIKSGKFHGWDDVRLPTLAAMRRRGVRAEAIRNFWISLGVSERDVAASMQNIEDENRKLVEKETNRYFFVSDPQPLEIADLPPQGIESHAPLHPEHLDRGVRVTKFGHQNDRVFLDAKDFQALAKDQIVRLKDLGNLRYLGDHKATYAGNDLGVLKQGARIVHWVSAAAGASVPVRVLMPDEEGTVIRGVAERQAKNDLGKVVQFERFGYVRLEADAGGEIVAPFTHT